MGQGSQLVYSAQPASEKVPRDLAAARMALTSPCAVGSFVVVTALAPSPTILPSRTTTAPNGPPAPVITLRVASATGLRSNSGSGWPGIESDSNSLWVRRQIQYGTGSNPCGKHP